MGKEEQLEVVTHLLLDPNAPDEEWDWVLNWLAQDLTDVERQSLASNSRKAPNPSNHANLSVGFS
jgi:hypothetical protein